MFIILASRRSGTHLLASLLNSHPDLRCYDEALLSSKWRLRFGRKKLKNLEEKEGCIIMYRQFIRSTDNLKEMIIHSKVIHLIRRNLDNHAKSFARTRTRTPQNIEYRKGQILKYRKWIFNGKYKFPNLFEIYYEDICNNKDIKEYKNDKLLAFLEVKPMKLTTNFTKGIDP